MDERDTHDPQERRPPLYNPEDYVTGLKRFSKLTGLQLYLGDMEAGAVNNNNTNNNNNNNSNNGGGNNKMEPPQNNVNSRKNKKNRSRSQPEETDHPVHGSMTHDREMELRQFATITELLAKLRSDLQLAFPSFVREFIGAPNDGVTWLLDALKCIQVSILLNLSSVARSSSRHALESVS
jgi:hypothetical protein